MFIHLFHGHLCSTASTTHENNIIISLSNFKELRALVYSSIQKLDNDYGIFFMGDHCVSVNYKEIKCIINHYPHEVLFTPQNTPCSIKLCSGLEIKGFKENIIAK